MIALLGAAVGVVAKRFGGQREALAYARVASKLGKLSAGPAARSPFPRSAQSGKVGG